MNKAKILFYDLENAPNLGWVWGKYDQNVLDFEQQTYMLSYSYRWAHEKQTHVVALPDFKSYKKNPTCDKELVTTLWELFNQADVLVAHNGNSFDFKVAQARFLVNGLPPPEPSKLIDTKLIAKRYFRFNSNSLNDLARLLGLGTKEETGGIALWFKCMQGDPRAWALMKRYNKQDTVLLYEVYEKMKGWVTSGPNLNIYQGTTQCCPNCGSDKVQRRGYAVTKVCKYHRHQCQSCGAWFKGEKLATDKIEYK